MAAKPETTFLRGVNKYVEVHHEKMNNPFRSGIADMWYSGPTHDLWIEYKYISKIPQKAKIIPDLSERQRDWLDRRTSEGRAVFVIVGCPEGGVIFTNDNWSEGMTADDFRVNIMTRKELGNWINNRTGVLCSTQSFKPQKRPKAYTRR